MNTDDFTGMFGHRHIRALLDWSRVSAPEMTVAEDFHTSPARLAAMHTLWYSDPTGRPAGYKDPEAAPLTVERAARLDMSAVPGREETLTAFTEQAARSTEPVQLILPAYRLRDGREVILDGTHRTVAAIRAGARVTVFTFALTGPTDAGVLPDLVHYGGRGPA